MSLVQEFVEPMRANCGRVDFTLEMIKIDWTPHFRTFTAAKNLNLFLDKTVPGERRLSTFDGPTKDIVITRVTSPKLINTLELLCKAIVDHVWEVSGGTTHVSLMTLYVQRTEASGTGAKLLYCTRLKVRKSAGSHLSSIKAPPPQEMVFQVARRAGDSDKDKVKERVKIKRTFMDGKFNCSVCLGIDDVYIS